ncbi:MAG: SRPBCC family protein [Anaerolineae bacterium]|nr:SRPBCC family protein [Anaerolineae bacterium]
MYFELSVSIERPPSEVFAFLRDKDSYPQPPDSPVLALDKTTSGPVGVGTCYREVVQMLPFVRGEIVSEITRYEPNRFLEERFAGAGMRGYLAYEFVPTDGGTLLIQRETVEPLGLLKLVAPVMAWMLGRRLRQRLQDIRADLLQLLQPADRAPSA